MLRLPLKRLGWIFCLLVAFPPACTTPPAAVAPGKEIGFFYTANRQGEVEPCGCQVNQLGGIDRFQSFLDQKRPSLAPRPVFFLDAGDTFFSAAKINPSRAAQEQVRAQTIAQAYAQWRVDAVAPGERDFAFGVERLRRLEKASGTTFLSTNLSDKQGQLLFAESRLLERSGAKVGVLSLASPESFSQVEEVRVLPAVDTARKVIAQLRSQGAEVIVVLSHLGLEGDRELAKQGLKIDLIFGSHSLDALAKPAVVDGTFIFQPQNQGQQAGLAVYRTPERVLVNHSLTDLEKSYGSSNESNQMLEQYKETVRKLGAAAAHGPAPEASGAKPYVAHAQYCRNCHQPQYDFWAKTKHSSAYLVLFAKNQHFDPECIRCHTLGFEEPGGFARIARPLKLTDEPAKAKVPYVETFMKTVFGPELKNGPLDSRRQPARYEKLAKRYHAELKKLEDKDRVEKWYLGVQCEHCHGLRDGHPDPKVPTLKKVNVDACKTCHTPPNAAPFEARMVDKVACPLVKRM